MHRRTLRPDLSRDDAGERLRLATHAGRRASRVMSAPRG
jgi:hypothetical protein